VQAFNDYSKELDSNCSAVTAYKQHCRMMQAVNGALDRLIRKRATQTTDFLVVTTALLEMRMCLVEHVLSLRQEHDRALVAGTTSSVRQVASARPSHA
jgi:hypothetical protein